MKITKQEQAEAVKALRRYLKPGRKVYTILNHCSSSGMSRAISLAVSYKGEVVKLDYWASRAMGYPIDRNHGGLKVGGCGMDMGFHLVYSLGQTVWPKGTRKPHGTRNGEPDTAGGYALKHVWL